MSYISLLHKDFNIDTIIIEVEESFIHLKDFLLNDAKKYITDKLCAVYGYYDNEKNMRGFISLSTSSIRIKEKHFSLFSWNIDELEWISFPIPAILIGKLLVDTNLRWKKVWEELLLYTLAHCLEISKTIGVRFVIVDANNSSIWFYEKYWFISIEKPREKTTKMVFDIKLYEDLP